MSGGPVEATIFGKILEWAWAGVGILMGIIWKKHNQEIAEIKAGIKKVDDDMSENVKFLDTRIDTVERHAVPLDRFEQNRKETREGQIAIYGRIDLIAQAIARIEGKLDK